MSSLLPLAAVIAGILICIVVICIHFKTSAKPVNRAVSTNIAGMPSDHPVVVLQTCSKSYDTPEGRIRILKSVDLDIEKGTITAIQGESGCGKSTLINILGGLDTPDSGTKMFFAGRMVDFSNRAAMASLRQQVGLIYQSHNLVPHLCALDNVALALAAKGWSYREARTRAAQWLQRVKLGDRLDYRPHQLSGGQQQRVGLARALVGSPRILLADEPTGNLDTNSAKTAMRLLRTCAVKMGIPVLIATHDGNLARKYCNRILQWCEQEGIFRDVQLPPANSVSSGRLVAAS